MKTNNLISSLATVSLGALAMVSCSNETPIVPSSKVNLTVTASKALDNTRTALEETANGDLECKWTAGDKILVTNANGKNLGVLDLDNTQKEGEGIGAATATFTGEIDYSSEGQLQFTYVGMKANASLNKNTVFSGINISNQNGTIESLSDYDILSKVVGVNIANSEETINIGTLARPMAFGHFTLTGVELTEGDVVTVSGSNLPVSGKLSFTETDGYFTPDGASENGIEITIGANGGNDIYLTVIPNGKSDLTFTLKRSENEIYTATLGEHDWQASQHVRKSEQNGDATIYTGIPVEMTKVGGDIPADDEDLVGPVFEINGKKFRFTKANLAYNVPEKRWYLLDKQWSFLCKKGWAYANGNYYGVKENDIDLFGFGCTGLFFSYFNDRLLNPTQFDEQINAPEYFIEKQLYAGQSIDGTQQGYKYPTQNDTCNEGYTGSNLEFGIQGFTMDWGVAYGTQQNSNANYFTLLSSEWSDLQSNYFFCGATITDVKNPNTNKNGIYGCMILDVNDIAAAKSLLGEYGATVTISSRPTFSGSNYQYFDYSKVKMTSEQFKALEAAGKVVFLPEAGHTSVTVNSYTKTDGYYWTATAGQAYTSTVFRFDGDSSPKVFKLDSQSSRIFGCSVRIVKEVK